jgi:lipopolysaccharide biosynthesis regulator YciM
MELAIPIIALGGLFIVGNQKKKKDNFETMGKPRNYLPNVDILPQNYPVVNVAELVDTVQEYPNPNQATDKYFNQTYFENKIMKV